MPPPHTSISEKLLPGFESLNVLDRKNESMLCSCPDRPVVYNRAGGRAVGLVSRRLCAAPACSEDAARVAAASPLPLRPGPRIKGPDSRHGPQDPPPKRHEPQERAAGAGAQGSRSSRPRTPRRLLARRGKAALVSGRPGASRGGSAAKPPWQPRQPGGKPGGAAAVCAPEVAPRDPGHVPFPLRSSLVSTAAFVITVKRTPSFSTACPAMGGGGAGNRAPVRSAAAASTSGLSAAGGGGGGRRAGGRDLTLKGRREVGALSPTPCRPSRGRACARCPAGDAAAPAERSGPRLSEDGRAGTSGAGGGERQGQPAEAPQERLQGEPAALGCFSLFPAEGTGPRSTAAGVAWPSGCEQAHPFAPLPAALWHFRPQPPPSIAIRRGLTCGEATSPGAGGPVGAHRPRTSCRRQTSPWPAPHQTPDVVQLKRLVAV